MQPQTTDEAPHQARSKEGLWERNLPPPVEQIGLLEAVKSSYGYVGIQEHDCAQSHLKHAFAHHFFQNIRPPAES